MASSNMVDTAVDRMLGVRKGSRGYTHEEIMIRIPRILWRNIRNGSLLVIPYLLTRRKRRGKAG